MSERFKATYLSSVLLGLFAHLFAFTNVLKNHDNILREGYGAGTASGRWFMNWLGDIISEIWGNYNLPFWDGILGIILLPLAAYLVVLLFDIQDRTLCILWGGIFMAFPAVTSLMFYTYTVPYYALAVLMAVASVYFTDRYRFGWIAAVLLLACSMGIYQAYYPMAVGLFVTVLFIRSLTGKYSVKEAFTKAFTYLGVLAGAMVDYFIMLRISLSRSGIQLSTYKGIDKMGQISIQEIPDMLIRTYKEFLKIPFDDYYQMAATKIVAMMLIFLAVLSAGMIVWLVYKDRKKEFYRKWPAVIFLVLYPAAINSITLMCYHSKIYTLMIFSGVLIYLMPILLLSEIEKNAGAEKKGKLFQWLRGLTGGALCVVMLNYIWQANGNYTAMYYTNQQTYNYLNSFVTCVKQTEGFTTDMKWALIGEKFRDQMFKNPWVDTPFWFGGNKKTLMNEYSRNSFIKQILGYEINWAESEQIKELEDMEEVISMPTYPNDGSVKIIDDTIVIKLENVN